jgi:hypothetical protein
LRKEYLSAFIPGLHDVLAVFEKGGERGDV